MNFEDVIVGGCMAEATNSRNQFNWKLPIYAGILALATFLPIVAFDGAIGLLLDIFVTVTTCLVLLVVAIVIAFRKNWLLCGAVFSMLVVFSAVSYGLLLNQLALHTEANWLLFSKKYKSEVLTQQVPPKGDLKHIEWDGWGWGSNDTSMYLVFDPDDSLPALIKSHPTGRLNGELCGVSWMRRLQNRWYAVLFYTNTAWGDCGPTPAN